MGSYRMCGCFTRKYRITEAEPPADVKDAFRKYAGGGPHMSSDQLRRFLSDQLHGGGGDAATVTAEEAELLVETVHRRHHHHPHITAKLRKHSLSLDDFHHFLFSADLNPPISDQVHHDMTCPLSHYFIYTGHNSYLTGNQLSSDCSDVPIIDALRRGVRVIELDLWPSSSRDDVHVLHGRTLTTPVELIKCLRSIKEHAFESSPYPVIITLEDHLTHDLQAKVAQMVTEIFGDMLFYPDTECLKEFPSPESMKHRIIISTKPPKEYLQGNTTHEKDEKSSQNKSRDFDENSQMTELSSKIDDGEREENDSSDSEVSENNKDNEDNNSTKCNIDRTMSGQPVVYKQLIAIHAGKPKGGLKEQLKIDMDKVRRLSLSEQKFEKATSFHATDVVKFTQNNFLRVYPKATRFDSSNYKPLVGWMHGAQMVALNMQGYGKSLWLMHGMFRANGSCGYVKKPQFLMHTDHSFDPKLKLPVKKTLKVKVYMGDGWHLDFKQTHFDLYSPPDFYTRVGIAGVPADETMKKTKKKEDNWTPVWDEEFTFPLTVPELALLRIEVNEYDMSEKDDFAGQTCLPVSELKPGIRAVPLFSQKGVKYKSVRLLMRFEFV